MWILSAGLVAVQFDITLYAYIFNFICIYIYFIVGAS